MVIPALPHSHSTWSVCASLQIFTKRSFDGPALGDGHWGFDPSTSRVLGANYNQNEARFLGYPREKISGCFFV